MNNKLSKNLILLCGGLIFSLSSSAQITKPKRAYLEYLVSTNSANRNYKVGEQAKVEVRAFEGGLPVNGYVHYSTSNDMMPTEQNDSVAFHDGVAIINVGTMHKAGFKTVNLRFNADNAWHKDMVKVGFFPDSLRSLTQNPVDFDKFWAKSFKAIASKSPKVTSTLIPRLCTDNVEVYLVKMFYGKKGETMYGYMSKPKGGGKHPVLFNPPGAGSKKIVPNNMYAEQGFISITSEIHGLNPELSDAEYDKLRKAVGGYNRIGIENRDSFYYRKVYVGCCKFVDYLCSLADWDGENVGVTGGSQGGALTIVTAALNPKVKFIASFYPALSDLEGFLNGRAGGWPQYFRGKETINKDKFMTTIPYYDVVNFARRLNVPGFYSYGYNDETCSPTSVTATINEISAPKIVEVTPTSGHWRYISTNDNSIEWLKTKCVMPITED